jgi:hypothetical protein
MAVADEWNAIVRDFLQGGPAAPDGMRRWAASYRGRGRGEVTLEAMPEPFLGPLTGPVAGIFLALNPGRAHLDFQSRDGVFSEEIESLGSYTEWAATWPYLRDPWVTAKGRNRHHATRLEFLRRWNGQPDLDPAGMVGFELYPWHSTAVTGAIRPDPRIIHDYVWAPIRELGAIVFAFGAPWFSLLEHGLGLRVVDRLGAGGRPYPTAVPSRAVTVFATDEGVAVVAERHTGGAGPPSATETSILREVVQAAVA